MAKIIGLTGGIASGKSTVSMMFKAINIPVIDADHIAKNLLNKDSEAYHEIIQEFGEEILTPDGQINRKKLAKILFDNEKARLKINEIIHPKVKTIIKQEMLRLDSYDEKVIVLDIPLLFETSYHTICDLTLLVYARQKDQVERLMHRDHISEEYALKKIKSQMPMSKKKELADYVIDNSKSILETKKAFERFIKKEVTL